MIIRFISVFPCCYFKDFFSQDFDRFTYHQSIEFDRLGKVARLCRMVVSIVMFAQKTLSLLKGRDEMKTLMIRSVL